MTRQESTPLPRGWTGMAALKGAGASVLLHLFVAAAVIALLSGPPKGPPQVIDLTLLPPSEIGRHPDPAPFVATTDPAGNRGSAALPAPPPVPEPPPLPASPIVSSPPALPSTSSAANPPGGGTAQANPSTPAGMPSASAPGSSNGPAATAASTVKDPVSAAAGIPPGRTGAGISGTGATGAGTAAGNYAWIRDAIQRASAYPPTARRMGWEGKVVVAFRLLSDGSVRDVRIVQGSGHAALDRGAIDAVRNASPFPRSPGEAEIITPVLFLLTPSP